MPPLNWQILWKKNEHKRDKEIVFYEPTHTYTVKGITEGYISCTGFLHEFFGHFDPDAIIRKMKSSRNWPNSKYYGKTDEEIKTGWAENGKNASEKGTAMHLAIEQFLNGAIDTNLNYIKMPIDNPVKIDLSDEVLKSNEWKYFMNFWKKYQNDLVPYRMEWEVWVEEIRLAGSIDAVFYRKSTNDYVILDWKRSKEIKKENKFQSGLGPVSHLPDCNYWHYTLQLNVYRWILEQHYGLDVAEMYLVIMHPDAKGYKRMRLNRMDDEVADMIECRRLAVLHEQDSRAVPVRFADTDASADADADADASSGNCLIKL